MQRYFFHVDDRALSIDHEGLDFPDLIRIDLPYRRGCEESISLANATTLRKRRALGSQKQPVEQIVE
jgi:hypothetical protein